MKGKGERGNRDRGLWGKRKRGRGFWPNCLLLPPSPDSEQRGGGIEWRPAWGERAPAVPLMAAAGKWLKMERRPRGIDPRAHLVLGWSEEAAPREGGGSAAVLRGGGAVELGGKGVRSLWWCVAAWGAVGPFYRRGRAVRPGGPRAREASTMAVEKISPLTSFRLGCGRDSR
jgi:hypothetical protein